MEKMNWLINTPIAHRGLFNNENGVPENSLPAFQAALSGKYPIELDLQILDDDEIVIFHDSYLSRMTGERGLLQSKTKGQIKNIKLLNSNQSIPLLREVLELIDGQVPILFELKSKRKVGLFEKTLLKKLAEYKGEFAVESFNPLSVRWFRLNAPHISRGQLYGGLRGKKLFTLLSNPDFGVFDVRYIPLNFLEKFREKKIPVIGYTVKNIDELNSAKLLLDNIIFEGFIP
jgi:glycerophosphoryl diester phosphodiesterase